MAPAASYSKENRKVVLEQIRAKLIRRKNEILAESSSCIKNRVASMDEACELRDEVDYAGASQKLWMETIHHNKRNRELFQIDKALQKIQDGTYGICENCEDAIPEKRLQVRPFATMCVSCQEECEKIGGSRAGRSIGDEDISPELSLNGTD